MAELHFPLVGTGRAACGARLTRTNCVRASSFTELDYLRHGLCKACQTGIQARWEGREQLERARTALARAGTGLTHEELGWLLVTEEDWIRMGCSELAARGEEQLDSVIAAAVKIYIRRKHEGKIV